MNNILFIAFEFPPINSGGSHRPYRFVKHLTKYYNVNPVVVTTKVDITEYDHESFYEDDSITIIRTDIDKPKALDNFKAKQYLTILDPIASRWEKHLFKTIKKINKEYNFKAMYVTAPPFSVANLGVKISKYFDIPLILDMRDSYSYWNITPFTSKIHYKLVLKREKMWFEHAKAIIVTAEELANNYLDLHPEIKKDKFITIRNSYPEKAKKIQERIKIRKVSKENPLLIGYVGSFYYEPYQRGLIFKKWWQKKPYQWFQYVPKKEDWLYRSPYYFFKVLKNFILEYPELSNLIKVEFIGKKPNWLISMIQDFNLEDIVKLKGFKPHNECLKFQKSCDVFLGTSHKVIDGNVYCIAGKTYEYIYMQKPILAYVKDGAQKDIFEESGLSILCDSDDIKHNVQVLKDLVTKETILTPNVDLIKQNYTGFTAQKLFEVLNKVIEDHQK